MAKPTRSASEAAADANPGNRSGRASAAREQAQSGAEVKHGPGHGLIQSVDRAIDILEALQSSAEPLSLAGVCALVNLRSSTCHHLLGTLAQRGYVARDPQARTYSLGNKLLELRDARSRQLGGLAVATPVLASLNRTTTEAVHLAVIEAFELATLAKFDSLHAVRVTSGGVGKAEAAHATATGKAIIAFWAQSGLDTLIRLKGLSRFTPHTICAREPLERDLALVRERGYAEDREEFQPGVVCIGAPIRNHAGEVVASLSASMPLMRADARNVRRVRNLVLQAAGKIALQMGYKEIRKASARPARAGAPEHSTRAAAH